MLGIKAAKDTKITFEPYWGEPAYHGWEGICCGKTAEPIIRKALLRRANSSNSIGEYIPGPTTHYLEYQFPQCATLEALAEFYEIDMEGILTFNDIEKREEIEIGDWICLLYVEEDAEIYAAASPDIEYEVQEGETVESIAALYDIGIHELIEPYGEENVLAGEENTGIEDAFDEGMSFEEITEPVYVLTPGDILLIP